MIQCNPIVQMNFMIFCERHGLLSFQLNIYTENNISYKHDKWPYKVSQIKEKI